MFCLYNFSLKCIIKSFYLSQDDPQLIRTSWLINGMLILLYPIYSIHSNLSINPNPTVLRPIHPQLPSHSPRYGQCTFSVQPALTAAVLSPCAWPNRTEPHRDIIYDPVFRPKYTTPHTLCQSKHLTYHHI